MASLQKNMRVSSFIPKSRGARPSNSLSSFIKNRLREIIGLSLIAFSLALCASLITHTPTDPSWNLAINGKPHNFLGKFGAVSSDIFLQLFGLPSYAFAFFMAVFGIFTLVHLRGSIFTLRIVAFVVGLFFLSASFAFWNVGGAFGYLLLSRLSVLHFPLLGFSCLLFLLGSLLFFCALGISRKHFRWSLSLFSRQAEPLRKKHPTSSLTAEEKGKELPSDRTRLLKEYEKNQEQTSKPIARPKTNLSGLPPLLPPLDLLFVSKASKNKAMFDEDTLQENATALENVLQDYGIRGEIVSIKPGPVVTLYELEPAPGLKSSRVIALADDIARSMSAVSARVAVIPGKNVIGIELPNPHRETVHLRELFSTPEYKNSKANLTLALGKDIGGVPVMADLSRMPHLLVAGTTGSGKSVAINAMILSLLYHLSPEQCKFIMIDPKMLELSIYDGIPHLLSPVVTDPKKAVIALRWVVREMESRYQAMSKLSVRNIEGYNERLLKAREAGEIISRKVQTGFDPETGQPIFEDQPLAMDPLPFIVVVVDEMADLMLVAGKEIESAVQRLAQMARAAGIHLIMATQRPSVDVITGTIKANFPTRISFQVTSRIDSRTILGEQGAEQLLGQGDMLHMASGGRISRVHGPYVGDADVEKVVQFLKSQSNPCYIDDITSDTGAPDINQDGGDGEEDELYQQALSLIYREGKASTSFIQRHLKIGYNRAARLIEKMEEDGVVSAPNHVGKRTVLARGDNL